MKRGLEVKYYYEIMIEDRKVVTAFSEKKYDIQSNIIIKTSRGEEYGKILAISSFRESDIYIIRKAIDCDYNKYLQNLRLSSEALALAKKEAARLGLVMSFINADVTFDKKHLLYQFVADERVDFRELAKSIASKFKMRIELRQIGARDKAKIIDGIGPCGRKLCCTTFLTKLDSISMNMAKTQGLALNPSKINGACGRLMCCLTYENDNYASCRRKLPQVGKTIETEFGPGKVVSEDILNLKYTVLVNDELKEIKVLEDEDRDK